ncbi:MAG: hypothetical protein AAGJ83_11865, partial [Planctomycetota bacterium]
MAIAPLRKVTLIGRATDKHAIVAGMQRLACMHVIDLAGDARPPAWEHPERNHLAEALKYLKQCSTTRPAFEDDSEKDVSRVAKEALINRDKHLELEEERDSLIEAIEMTKPWGEFSLPDADSLGGMQLWFYRIRHRSKATIPPDVTYQDISRDREYRYFIVIAADPPESLPQPLTLDGRSLSELKKRLASVELAIEESEIERIALTRWVTPMEEHLQEAENQIER